MKILITGHRGFIGQHMVNALKDEHELSFFEWGDPNPDFKGLDWCIHLGAETSTTETNVEKVLHKNYDFTRFVMNECENNKVNMQFASSASVYGQGTNFREEALPSPQSPYAWSKLLCERYLIGFRGRWTVKFQIFRYFNVYGTLEDHKGDQASPYSKFEKQAKETGVIKLFEGSDNYLRDFVPVEHIVEVHKQFLNINESGIWNLGTGRATSFEDVARMVADKYNAKVEYIPMPESVAKQYQRYTCADITRLTESLNAKNSN
jgi:ADP-L-glycero-D-manno-heptose 6-epimerase